MTKKQAAAAKAKHIRATWRKVKNIWPLVDETYKDWIRTLPCVVCFCAHRSTQCFIGGGIVTRIEMYFDVITHMGEVGGVVNASKSPTQCAHLGVRGLRQKCSDRETGPLCGKHHDRGEPEGHHELGKKFWEHHGIDRDVLIAALNEAYEATQRRDNS